MVCCLNPNCTNPDNPDRTQFCQSCGVEIISLLLNRFKVTQVLGQGGFGRTYLAQDTHKFNESCVVKQLVPNNQGTWAQNKAVELFKLEAQQLQQLGENSHIPSLYAYFQQEGYFYLVQQFIKGQDLLKELNQKGVWKEAEIQQLLLELLPVLQFIHTKGVIHRDIKPENIMRRQLSTTMGNSGDLVLIDFGVSKQLSNTVLKTTVGTLIGSQGYAPMEQMLGGKAYTASDLFSLGATCFHLLTNTSPFQLFVDGGYSWTNNWHSHLPSNVSNELVRVMDKLLTKNVERRYQSAAEVIKDWQTPIVSPQSPTIPISPTLPQPQPVTKTSKQPKKKQLSSLSLKKLKLDKRLLTGATIALISLVGYLFQQVVSQTTTSMITPTVSSKNLTLLATLNGYASYVYAVAFSPDGKTLASASANNTIKLCDLDSKKTIATLTGHSHYVESVAFSPDGKILASASADNTIKLWYIDTKTEITTLIGHVSEVYAIAFSPDGKTVASGSTDNTIKLWDINTKKVIVNLTGHSSDVYSVAFSSDGKTVASGSTDNTVKLWDIDSKQEIATLIGHSNTVYSVAFSPDGKNLASGSLDNTIKLWDVDSKQEIATLTGHLSEVYSVTFSPDGKNLASGSYDNTVKLWDIDTKTEIATLTGHSQYIESVAFSPDGKILASASADETIKLWLIP